MKKKIKIDYRSKVGFNFRHFLTEKDEMSIEKHDVNHSHPYHEIYYLVSGEATINVSGMVYKVKKGDVVCIYAFESHSIVVSQNEDYERYVVEFDASKIPTFNEINPLDDCFSSKKPSLYIPSEIVNKSKLLSIFKSIEKEVLSINEYTNHLIFGDIIKLVTEMRLASDKTKGLQHLKTNVESKTTNAWLNKITTYIKVNLNKKITIEELAKHVYLSKSYLQHLFKDTVGISISEYIFKQKMHMAQYMLKNGSSLNDVSNALGFKYYSTFCMSYKKMFNCSPKEHFGKP